MVSGAVSVPVKTMKAFTSGALVGSRTRSRFPGAIAVRICVSISPYPVRDRSPPFRSQGAPLHALLITYPGEVCGVVGWNAILGAMAV